MFLAVFLAGLAGPWVAAAGAAGAAPNRVPAPDPAFAPVADHPGRPRVLLIGDSISIGYTVPVRERLGGRASIHRIPVNGGPTTNGLAHLDEWLGSNRWDVIHFNWGLHDLKYVGPGGSNAVPGSPGSRPQVSLEDYGRNLAGLVKRLRATGATLIWCNTTPIPEGAQSRVPGDELKYNAAAARVMQTNGVFINDLHEFASRRLPEIQKRADVHFTAAGSMYLGTRVAAAIQSRLPQTAVPGVPRTP